MRSTCRVITGTALAALLVWPGLAADPLEADRAERGKHAFRIYCSTCHGENGQGDGPTAGQLRVQPSDLTRISQRNGGSFPFEQVLKRIDGRNEIPAHGTQEMPIWGIALQEWNKDSDQRAEIAGRLLELTTFVKSIQTPAQK